MPDTTANKTKPKKVLLKSPCYKCEAIQCNFTTCRDYIVYCESKDKKDKMIDILGAEYRLDKMTYKENCVDAVYKKN